MDQNNPIDAVLAEESARKAERIRANEDQVVANAARLDPTNHSERAEGLREAAADIQERREWAGMQAFAPFLFGELGEQHRTEQAHQLDDSLLADTNLVAELDRSAWTRDLHESLTRTEDNCDRIDRSTNHDTGTARTEPQTTAETTAEITAAPVVHQEPGLDRGLDL